MNWTICVLMPFALWENELCNKYFEHQTNTARPWDEKDSFFIWSSTVSINFSANGLEFKTKVPNEKLISFWWMSKVISQSVNFWCNLLDKLKRNSFRDSLLTWIVKFFLTEFQLLVFLPFFACSSQKSPLYLFFDKKVNDYINFLV